ncbi:MAG: hypothetical protein HZA68_07625 [Rhodovulum sp.]|nr:hypothetical protein [Rhodovulum sp.]
MRATIAEYLRMSPEERSHVTELTDGKERPRNPLIDDDEEYDGEARDRGHR